MSDKTPKQRARRVASDEAHAWARSLQLNNPVGKSVLRALTLYVNGDGSCFVSIDQLAEDTDLSPDTVRRRLVWLEQIGAIVRLPQWLDGNGRRNSEARGKRTTDDIRLLIEANVEEIERRAKGQEPDNSPAGGADGTDISPSSLRGLNEAVETTTENVSPPLALGQPSQSCGGLISEPEPEPEDSPQPPFGGSMAPEGWKDFEEDWIEPILRQSMAQQVWSALKPEERALARRAARGYVAHRKSLKKPPNVLGAHLFLKERDAWEKFAKLAPDTAGTSIGGTYAIDSREGRALLALYAVARTRPAENRSGLAYRGEITPQILAFADVDPRRIWIEDRQQIGAWSRFLGATVLHPNRPPLIETRGIGADTRRGIYAPELWPPLKDGNWSTAGPDDDLSDQELADFK